MEFNVHPLGSPFNTYIESVFHYKHFTPDHSIERVVPTGHIFILFELDGFTRHTYDNESLDPNATFTEAWISGMHRNYISISAHQDSEMFVIQFKAFGAHPFLHLPVEELNEKILPASEFPELKLQSLRTELINGKTSEEKFKTAERWLSQQFDEEKTPPSDLLDIIQKLQEEPAGKYSEIIKSYPKSQKHLIDQFKKYVGLTPKYYQRVLRFNDILQKIREQENITWSEIAYQSGLSDQSHFIKEFRHFSGFNPEEYLQRDFHQDEPNFFPLDRKG